MHLAVASAIAFVGVLGAFLTQQRTVHVIADGNSIEIRTPHSDDRAVIAAAGVEVGPGDRITELRGEGADVLRIDRARRVTLRIDGQMYEYITHARTIDQLLSEADANLSGRDSVWQDGSPVSMTAPLEPRQPLVSAARAFAASAAIHLEVRRAVGITLVDRDREIATTTSRATVAQALREAEIVVGPNDQVSPPLDAEVDTDASIEVRHALAVTLRLPDDERVVYTFARTVADVLAEESVALPEGTFVDPPVDAEISDGLAVRVVQLSASREIEREFIKSRTVYRSDASLGPGQTRTEEGRDGALVRRYDVQYANGVEAGRTLIEEYYEPEPVDTVIYYPVQNGLDQDAPTEGEVVRVINVYATYYTPASSGRSPNDPAYARTATGVLVTYGIVAVDPTVIPLGTRMFIPGYGYAIAADTGGAVKGYIIDLGYPDGVPVDWRSRWLDIYILS
jgi:uncharacterized protein YabE (DUF348 family)